MSDIRQENSIVNGPEQALIDGCRIHAFLSGGGLRVVSIQDSKGNERGYGEAPWVEDALAHAVLDYSLGHETYAEQYSGDNARHAHYLTGSSDPSSDLDQHLLAGNKFDAFGSPDGNGVIVSLAGYKHSPSVPRELVQRVADTQEPATYEERGVTYLLAPYRFPGDNSPGVQYRVLKKAEGAEPFAFYRVTKTGIGQTFAEAATAAIAAEEVEPL